MNLRKYLPLRRLLWGMWFFVLILNVLASAAEIKPADSIQVVARCGGGILLEMGGQRVLYVSGDPYQMGFQQGTLLKAEVRALIQKVLWLSWINDIKEGRGINNPSLREVFVRTKPFIDPRYMDEMRGLADGAGLMLAQVQFANTFPELFHCSGFALFGKATEGGQMLHGRILDYMTGAGLQDFAVLTIARPQGYHPFVTVGYAGFIGSVTGMNDQKIAMGEMGGRGEGDWDGMPMSFLLRKGLEECSHLEESVALFKRTPRTCEFYYVISDAKIPDARGLSCTPSRFEVILPGKPYSQLPQAIEQVVLMSEGRRYNTLAAWVKEKYGHIDIPTALDLMNRPVAMDCCLHRVLMIPAAMKIYVAHAGPVGPGKYEACYQPYYEFDIPAILKVIDQLPPLGK